MIYLDHSATTPLAPAVQAAMDRVERLGWGNPSSVHGAGRRARSELERARAKIAECLGSALPTAEDPYPVVFLGSGSEANNLALQGLALARGPQPVHLVVSAIEHDSVLNAAAALARRHGWFSYTTVDADASGIVDPAAIERAWRPETSLLALMLVNHETGMIQRVAEVAAWAHRRGALVHCDAVQAMGRMKIEVELLDCDTLSIAAHKFYGPKGVGILWARRGGRLEPLILGGAQEGGWRAGTPNVAGAAGAALAAEMACQGLVSARARLAALEFKFLEVLRAAELPFEINGLLTDKIPGVLNLAIKGIHRDDLVVGMDVEGIAISAGSACASGVMDVSHVLRGMNLPPWRVQGGIRISFGAANTLEEAEQAARTLAALAQRLAAGRDGAAPGEDHSGKRLEAEQARRDDERIMRL